MRGLSRTFGVSLNTVTSWLKKRGSEQQTAAGKESGLTAHVERWNLTLRRRLGRFVRKSLSFSQSDTMHELCLRLFLHDYNKSLALSYD